MLPARSRPLSPLLFIIIGASVVAIGPLTIDMYLPAMPAIQRDLLATAGEIQHSMSAYLIGLAFGQLLYGPTSDAFGRKRPLLVGQGIYLLATVGCALAPNVEMLTGMRLLQALGGSAGAVTVRAMIRDQYPPQEMARALSLLTLVMGAAPIVAPVLGAFIHAQAGWRMIFWVLVAYVIVSSTVMAWAVPETRTQAPGRLEMGSVWRSYARMLRHRRFMAYALAGAVAQAGLFAYVSASAFVFTEVFDVADEHIALLFAINSSCYIASSQVNRYMLKTYRAETLMRWALAGYLVATVSMTVLALTGWGGLPAMMVTMAAALASMGFSFPNSTAVALAPFGDRAGTAASLMGTMQFVIASIVSYVIGRLHEPSAVPLALAMLGCAVSAQAALRLILPPGEPLPARRNHPRED